MWPPARSLRSKSTAESEIEHFVDSLPENGEWWRGSGRVTFILAAKRLCNLGVGVAYNAFCTSGAYLHLNGKRLVVDDDTNTIEVWQGRKKLYEGESWLVDTWDEAVRMLQSSDEE
jgi:hypothetical protein